MWEACARGREGERETRTSEGVQECVWENEGVMEKGVLRRSCKGRKSVKGEARVFVTQRETGRTLYIYIYIFSQSYVIIAIFMIV